MPDVDEILTGTAEELRQVVLERIDAVTRKDPGPLAARQAPDVVTFDVLPPLRRSGSEAVAAKTRAWFDGYATDIGYQVVELQVTAESEVGFCSFLYHVSGTLISGGQVDMWVRATLCLQKVDGTWKITHDHESVPFDPQTGLAVLDQAP